MQINNGDTAYVLVSSALVLLMTPALAFFYGGLVRRKNVLNTMMIVLRHDRRRVHTVDTRRLYAELREKRRRRYRQSGQFWADRHQRLLGYRHDTDLCVHRLPDDVRRHHARTHHRAPSQSACKFPALMAFVALWSIVVYYPLAHMLWGPGGFLAGLGAHGLRRRQRRAHLLGRVRARRLPGAGQAQGPRRRQDDAPQRAVRAAGRGPAVVRLVRIQLRFGALAANGLAGARFPHDEYGRGRGDALLDDH